MEKVELGTELLTLCRMKENYNVFNFFDYFQEAFLGSNFSISFNMWSKDVYSELKIVLSSSGVLPLLAFMRGWCLYFEIATSLGSKRFILKPLAFFLGKF